MDISLKVDRLLEDIFQPMKGKELKHVSSMTYKGKYVQVALDLEGAIEDIDWNTIEGGLDRPMILDELQETCEKLGLNKEDDHTYSAEGKNINLEYIADTIDSKLDSIGIFASKKIDKDKYGITIEFICNDFGDNKNRYTGVSISSGNVIINKKTGRWTEIEEDIFKPMGDTEQAEIEKNFEYRIGIIIHNPITEGGRMIKELLISNGFIYSPSISLRAGVYHKTVDTAKSWSYEAQKIIDKLKETGKKIYYKSNNKDEGNIYIGPHGYPTLPDITVRGERIKKKITEDIFAPMSDVEKKEVESQIETVNRASFDVKAWTETEKDPSNIVLNVINKIIKIIEDNGFKPDASGEGYYGYETWIKDDINESDMIDLLSKILSEEKNLNFYPRTISSYIPFHGKLVYRYNISGKKLPLILDIAFFKFEEIRRRKKISEDIFQPMSGTELSDVNKEMRERKRKKMYVDYQIGFSYNSWGEEGFKGYVRNMKHDTKVAPNHTMKIFDQPKTLNDFNTMMEWLYEYLTRKIKRIKPHLFKLHGLGSIEESWKDTNKKNREYLISTLPPYENLKQLPAYKKLTQELGLVDITTPLLKSRYIIKFRHDVLAILDKEL